MIIQIATARKFQRCHKALVRSGVPKQFAWSIVFDALHGKATALLWIKLAFMCRHLEPVERWR